MFLKIYILSVLMIIVYIISLIVYIKTKYGNDVLALMNALDKLEEMDNNASVKEESTSPIWFIIAFLTPIFNTLIALMMVFATPSTLKSIDKFFEDDSDE